jgi:nitrate/nitrite transporter NarK
MDRFGHRKLQFAGFAVMGACFAVIGLVPGMTTAVVPFLLAYGISYFFTEFGPNVTTFVLPGEVFPTRVRATGHGISAGIGKLGAFSYKNTSAYRGGRPERSLRPPAWLVAVIGRGVWLAAFRRP